MELENKKKVAVDANDNVMAFKYQSASLESEVEDYPIEWESEEIFTEQQVNRFKVVDGKVVRRTEEEIKADPTYAIVCNEQKVTEYKANNGTDNEFIRALRELLKDPEIRAKLSDDTQQRIANTELQVEAIKGKYI